MSIRLKVILPYLILTLIVAVIGVYVVTRLVSNTLSERLTNQLLEAGRVVSDSFVRQEVAHVDNARIVAYTQGVAEALQKGDREKVLSLVRPAASGLGIENLMLITPDGKELVQLIADKNGVLQEVTQDTGAAQSPIVTPFLKSKDETAAPHRAMGVNLVNNEYYYYTALPVPLGDEFAGVVVIGTSMDTMLPFFKNTALADIIIYGGNGQVIGTTLNAGNLNDATIQTVSISQDDFNSILKQDTVVSGENLTLNLDEREYRLARGPLQVGNDRIGVFAVVLPTNFVVEKAQDNRTTYVILFTSVFFVVILIGVIIARLIIVPLYSLMNTSQAIAGGNLEQRTGIHSKDEIGTLAETFDEMTERLQERTLQLKGANEALEKTNEALEKSNEALDKMNKTKTNFIQISAHELRTPLTLIMGYSQMLEDRVKEDPESAMLARGILDGSDRMNEIVSSMLDVSRIDSNALFLKKTELQLELVLKKVQKEFAKALNERNIHFSVVGMDKLPPIPADPELIQKVFYHLVMNAIKFTPDGGDVTVCGKYINGAEPPRIEVSVKDTGIGIDPKVHQMIFEKFYQTGDVLLHSSGKTKFKGGGPGLGLAIARGIVEAHGGMIWVESKEHNEETFPGSTFHVSLPVRKNSE
jgi:signal transduction histidine kinase